MNKMTSFQTLVYSHLPMVVSVTETWLSNYIFDNEVLPSGYNTFRASRGGVLLAVSSDLFVSLLYCHTDPCIVTVRLLTPSLIIVCSVYLPPSHDDSAHSFLLSYLYDLFTSSSDIVIVTGDFNCPDINWDLFTSKSPFSAQLCDLVLDLGLTQLVDAPTHGKGGILDLVITNSSDYIQNLYIDCSLFTLSDHFPICFTVLSVLPHLSPSGIKFLNYSKTDFEGMCDFLLDWDFTPCLNSTDVDFIWSHIKSAIYVATRKFVNFRHHWAVKY